MLIDPSGQVLLKHRKINLLDIEQGLYSTGDRLAVAETACGVLGVNISADNFPDSLVLGHSLARMEAQILLSPCAWAVPAEHDPVAEPYGALWEGSYRSLASLYEMPVVGVSNVGWITGGPWTGRKCIGCSLAVGACGEILAKGPYGVENVVARRWTKNRETNDIIALIQTARDSGDRDEAIWRSFLAAHFGRASADPHDAHSASAFLCAFGEEPYWTWQRVHDDPGNLRTWLANHAADLQSLSYGNHRKYESKWPDDIWAVVESFVTLAERSGGPMKLVTLDGHKGDVAMQFDALYRRLSPLWRFGRTGRFDFLVLMIDLRLISAEPSSCYLHGATGPLRGAKQLWGKRPIGELEQLATDLAEQLGVSPVALEDALCNWQK